MEEEKKWIDVTEREFQEYLDENFDKIEVLGMYYSAGYALKKLDLIAFHCALAEYEDDINSE